MFSDAEFGGSPIRLVTFRKADGVVVQVGETLHKRNRLMWELMAESLVPIVLIALLSGLSFGSV